MSHYLLSVHMVEGEGYPSEEEMQQAFKDVDALNQELMGSGQWVFGGGLMPIESATTVDNTGGQVVTTDGPYAETKEHLGGFWIIDVADLDAALHWARRAAAVHRRPVEVAPFEMRGVDELLAASVAGEL